MLVVVVAAGIKPDQLEAPPNTYFLSEGHKPLPQLRQSKVLLGDILQTKFQ